VGIPLKLAIILPACTFNGIYVYQRDRGFRVAFLERLTRDALQSFDKLGGLIVSNVNNDQVEYMNEEATELFLKGNLAEIIQPETGLIKSRISKKILERLNQAFLKIQNQTLMNSAGKKVDIKERPILYSL
jgi:hypothetical protein